MAKTKSYQIQAKLNLLICVEVSAANLDEALVKAKGLKETDFIEFGDSEYMDGDMRISEVYESCP